MNIKSGTLLSRMDHSSPHPNLLHVSIISVKQPLGDLLLPSLPPKYVDIAIFLCDAIHINPSEPNQLRIPFHPLLEPADSFFKPDYLCSTTSRKVQDLFHRQLVPFFFLLQSHGDVSTDESCLSCCFENRRAVTAAHIRTKTNSNTLIPKPAYSSRSTGEGAVTAWTMRDLASSLCY
ncbi:hypothetical protein HG531_003281 [Fusarium graminearum]|nr:hypothetical protein HG531_003281 [Fusarium graminearum]